MLSPGPAKKITIYVNEDTQYHHRPLYDAILSFLLKHGVSGATASRAFAGFGSHHALHDTTIEHRAEHLPIRLEFIDTPAKIDEILPALADMVADGVIEIQDTTVIRKSS